MPCIIFTCWKKEVLLKSLSFLNIFHKYMKRTVFDIMADVSGSNREESRNIRWCRVCRINNRIHVPVLSPISNVTITNNSTFLTFFTGQVENNDFELENSLQMSKFHRKTDLMEPLKQLERQLFSFISFIEVELTNIIIIDILKVYSMI